MTLVSRFQDTLHHCPVFEIPAEQPTLVTQEHNRVGHRHPLRPFETCPVTPRQFHVAHPHRARTIPTCNVPNNTVATETCVPVACEHIRAHQGPFPISLKQVPLVLLEFHMQRPPQY